jgi:transcriptional regulator
MPDQPTDPIQGTRDACTKDPGPRPLHGYGIALRIEQISDGAFRVNPGSLLPALSRMERAGRVKGEWRATENNRRARYYSLTEKGRKALKSETENWGRQIAAINRILEA